MSLFCSDLSVSYNRQLVLEDFHLSLDGGEVHALIGPNGSGKSTALQALAGLMRPVEGRVLVNGDPVNSMSRGALAKRLSFLPQQPVAPDEMTVGQLVRQGRFAHVGLFRSYGMRDERVIQWSLKSTGLSSYIDRPLKELSGGERQRAWISAAIAQEAKILLLDEPTSFLDIGYQVEILDLVHYLSVEREVAVVMAIHDLNQAMTVCQKISLLEQGRQVFYGDPHALATSGLIEKVFQVEGRFVDIAENTPPYFDVKLKGRPRRKEKVNVGSPPT